MITIWQSAAFGLPVAAPVEPVPVGPRGRGQDQLDPRGLATADSERIRSRLLPERFSAHLARLGDDRLPRSPLNCLPKWGLDPLRHPTARAGQANSQDSANLGGCICGWIHGLSPSVPPPPEAREADRAKPVEGSGNSIAVCQSE